MLVNLPLPIFLHNCHSSYCRWQSEKTRYSRTRKSEQIKIARECMDRIVSEEQKFDEFYDKNSPEMFRPDRDLRKFVELTERMRDVLVEIEYFTYLADKHEIRDEMIIKYYFTKVMPILGRMEDTNESFRSCDQTLIVKDDITLSWMIATFYKNIKNLDDFWWRYRRKGMIRTR
jgi:hypothetical protein